MFGARVLAIGVFALAALSSAEPLPATTTSRFTCPQQTTTVTATCTGKYNCPLKKPCTTTVTTARNCGGNGPVCVPGPTPTVTFTVDKGCTSPCGGSCAYTATATTCSFFHG